MINPNDGERLSKFQLDRYATGELSDAEAAAVRDRLDERSQAHLDALQQARGEVAPFDAAALRERAGQPGVVQPAPRVPPPANDSWGYKVLVPLLALAAILFVAVLPQLPSTGEGDVRFRSGDMIEAFQLQQGVLQPYDGTAVGEGDTLGFKVGTGDHRGVVVLSVDGTGQVSVFWPEQGDRPEPLEGDGLVALDGTVVLDGAPGPEVFVAVFDKTVSEARREVEHAFQSGGHAGLLEWAQLAEGTDAVKVQRR